MTFRILVPQKRRDQKLDLDIDGIVGIKILLEIDKLESNIPEHEELFRKRDCNIFR